MRKPLNLLVAVSFCLLGAGSVWAQAADNASGAEGKSSDLTSDENLSLIDEDVASLSNEQKLERASRKIKGMRKVLSNTTQLLETVREEERDVLKINCINEKQATTKGFVKVSEQSYIKLEGAVKKGDRSAADHNYKLISVAHQKVEGLAEEAQLCTGEERRYTGKRDIQVVQPTNGKEDIDGPEESDILVEDLPELSPYQ